MRQTIKIEASLACANFRNLEVDIAQLKEAAVDYLHIDIMDGKFVPNFALDFRVMEIARSLCDIPQECHLMVVEPERYIARAVSSGAECVAIHYEATAHVQRALQQIRDSGAKSGIVLNPATPLTSLEYILDDIDMITIMTVNPGFAGQKLIPATMRKIRDCSSFLRSRGYDDVGIQVDGNVSFANIAGMVMAGATMLVCGTSSVFHESYSIGEAVGAVREIVKHAEAAQ